MKYSKLFSILLISVVATKTLDAKVVDLLKESKETLDFSAKNDKAAKRDYDLRRYQHAFNNSAVEDNIAEFEWEPKKIFKVNMRMHMKTLIYLPEDEEVKAYTIGDNFSFQVSNFGNNFKNLLDIQSLYAGVDTNLTVIGKSGRIYSFYLRSYPVKSRILPDFTIYVRAPKIDASKSIQFVDERNQDGSKKSEKEIIFARLKRDNDYLKDIQNYDQINIDYKLYGDEEVAPYAVYDDGKWTYFDFREREFSNDRLPVIYKVVDKFDSIINTRIEDGFLIAESISSEGWTLRNGDKVICVRPKRSWLKKFSRSKNKPREEEI